MALRVIEIVTPRSDKDEVKKSLEEHQPDAGYVFWASPLDDEDSLSFRVVLDVAETANVMDELEERFAWTDKYRIVVYSAEATLPRLDKLAMEEEEDGDSSDKKDKSVQAAVSREELYADVLDTSLLSRHYVMLVTFSCLVGVIGLLRDNVAIIIGAMVLAPLLGPNVGLSLATTLGDMKLARSSLLTLAVGVLLCFVLSAGVGLILGIPEMTHELSVRSMTSYSDIILAMVSGAAGIITVTLGVPTSLVGVMVALSLLPPLIAGGLFLGAGMFPEAGGAGLLFAANIICLNLAGVGTFLIQGIRPLSWYEKERAKKATIQAALVWTVLLAALIGLMFLKTH
ncbi:TIGR00341 family protein [uncultured Pseudodesulfovibrio sp.]|uniref:TIGR00341 family protein n=1 Tax=uncultured Pseudodesulfovibrio sp. TaxID=2035858 RepID=UPI0029C7F827|nr:TIGR00341 family protein [uncultured Pseudodesulfovibrio sp.]